jgi:hypothetical protein
MTLQALRRIPISTSFGSLWHLGLGADSVTDSQMVGGAIKAAGARSETAGFFVSVLFANVWQLIFTLLYLLYNSLLTRLIVAEHWSCFSLSRKALRVSIPKSFQRSSYVLSLPYRYGVVMTCVSILIHWLLSQSLFLFQTTGVDSSGKLVPRYNASRVGYAPLGIVFILILGGILVVGLALMGLKKYFLQLHFLRRCANYLSGFPRASMLCLSHQRAVPRSVQHAIDPP